MYSQSLMKEENVVPSWDSMAMHNCLSVAGSQQVLSASKFAARTTRISNAEVEPGVNSAALRHRWSRAPPRSRTVWRKACVRSGAARRRLHVLTRPPARTLAALIRQGRNQRRAVFTASVLTRCGLARHVFVHVLADVSRQTYVFSLRAELRDNTLRAAGRPPASRRMAIPRQVAAAAQLLAPARAGSAPSGPR
ncbi:unnamed protein product, partial [Prorocentrum cordatum]